MVIKHVCNISVSQVPVRVVLIKIVEKFSTTSKYYNATGVSNCKSCSTCESFLGEGWGGVGWAFGERLYASTKTVAISNM